jgi:hypothetical protein
MMKFKVAFIWADVYAKALHKGGIPFTFSGNADEVTFKIDELDYHTACALMDKARIANYERVTARLR